MLLRSVPAVLVKQSIVFSRVHLCVCLSLCMHTNWEKLLIRNWCVTD